MKTLPYFLRGGFIAVAYVLVILFLKTICQPEWCFADIFLPFMFKPLIIFDYFLSSRQIAVLGSNLFWTTIVSWFLFGAILGSLYGLTKKKNK